MSRPLDHDLRVVFVVDPDSPNMDLVRTNLDIADPIEPTYIHDEVVAGGVDPELLDYIETTVQKAELIVLPIKNIGKTKITELVIKATLTGSNQDTTTRYFDPAYNEVFPRIMAGLVSEEVLEEVYLRDKQAQRAIADRLLAYSHIDLSIPAQRDIANKTRASLGLPPLQQRAKVQEIPFMHTTISERGEI